MTQKLAALFLAGILSFFPFAVRAEAPLAYVIKIDGVISPATYDLVGRHLKRAEEKGAAVVVLEMHTPGGLYESTQQVIQSILDSPMPVVTYVSPAGSHAASAGTYILYGSHIAAMAPGTNLGAATPVQMGGEKPPGDKPSPSAKTPLEQKMVNDAAAYIRSLAALRGRNADWAEKSVRAAESLTATEARNKKVIDLVAGDLPELLAAIDGRVVNLAQGKTVTLHTKGARVETVLPDWRTQLLDIITNPNVAFLLMTFGFYGIIYEFAHPGAFVPGIAGGICLLLGLFAMNILPISYAGLGLLFVGLILMTAEALTPAFGALGIGGAVAFAAGATLLIDSSMPGFGVDPWLIAAMTVSSLGILSVLLALAVRAQRKPTVTGIEELVSATGEVVSWLQGQGEVRVTGEIWQAWAAPELAFRKGDKIKVAGVEGLRLKIIPQQPVKGA